MFVGVNEMYNSQSILRWAVPLHARIGFFCLQINEIHSLFISLGVWMYIYLHLECISAIRNHEVNSWHTLSQNVSRCQNEIALLHVY